MLTSNLWNKSGLNSGRKFRLLDVILDDQNEPLYVIAQFNITENEQTQPQKEYIGPSWDPRFPGTVPIKKKTAEIERPEYSRSDEYHGKHARTQFPIRPAYGFTTHKSQGLGMPRVIIKVGKNENPSGQLFTATSRVEAHNGLVYEDFPESRLHAIRNASGLKSRLAFETYLENFDISRDPTLVHELLPQSAHVPTRDIATCTADNVPLHSCTRQSTSTSTKTTTTAASSGSSTTVSRDCGSHALSCLRCKDNPKCESCTLCDACVACPECYNCQ